MDSLHGFRAIAVSAVSKIILIKSLLHLGIFASFVEWDWPALIQLAGNSNMTVLAFVCAGQLLGAWKLENMAPVCTPRWLQLVASRDRVP